MHSLAIAAAACGFGAVSVLAKLAYEAGAGPPSLFAARVVVAGVLLGPLALRRQRPAVAGSPPLAVVAGVAFAMAGLLEFEALSRLPASVLVTIVFTSPLWIALASWARSGVPPVAGGLLLFALVAAGLAMLVRGPAGRALDPLGVGIAVAASMLFGAVFLLIEALVRHGARVRAVAVMTMTAAGVAATLHGGGAVELLRDPSTRLYAVGIGGLTAASLLLLAAGMERTPAFQAAVIAGVEPVAATLLALILLGEALTPVQAVGGLAVVAGVTGMSRAAGAA
jgi:drug/metabolite transporter (DMT)-like permease